MERFYEIGTLLMILREVHARSMKIMFHFVNFLYSLFRQQLERLPNRRPVETNKNNAAGGTGSNTVSESQSSGSHAAKSNSPFLLARLVLEFTEKGQYCSFFNTVTKIKYG